MCNSNTISSFEHFYEYAEKLAKKWGLKSSSDPRLPTIMTSDPKTPEVFLALFAQSTEPEILKRLAMNPNTPKDVLEELACHYDNSVRLAVANNSIAPDYVSEALADDDSDDVRYAVASNPNSSNDALGKLENDSNSIVVKRASKTMSKQKIVGKHKKIDIEKTRKGVARKLKSAGKVSK